MKSLRQELDMAGRKIQGNTNDGEPEFVFIDSETYAIEYFESTMSANDEVTCTDHCGHKFPKCEFKITRKQLETEFNDDEESASGELWTHMYGHVRKYRKRNSVRACTKHYSSWNIDGDIRAKCGETCDYCGVVQK